MRCVWVCLLVAVAHGAMLLTSPAFHNFESIPRDYGCEEYYRQHLMASPPLEWHRPPAKSQSFVLMVDDIDSDGFVHWLVTDIPKSVNSLPADASGLNMPEGSVEHRNSFGESMYGGMCPPFNSSHTYRFRVYARNVNHSELILPAFESQVPLTSSMIDDQLTGDEHTLYVAVLAGIYKMGPRPIILKPPPPPPPRPPVTTDPLSVIRYVKPSESRQNLRKHYGPRPYGHFPYNVTEFCERKRGKTSDLEYAQLCNATLVFRAKGDIIPPPEVPEVSHNKTAENELLAKGGMNPRYFDVHKLESGRPWIVSDEGIAIPPDAVVAKHVEKTPEELIKWDCNTAQPQQLMIRSPVFDSCDDDEHEQIAGKLPVEFMCDLEDKELIGKRMSRTPFKETISSPPLNWKILDDSNVVGFVIVLEQVSSGRTYWVLQNIPPAMRSITLGASGSFEAGVEVVNSFKAEGYTSPCSVDSLTPPSLVRFHIYALSATAPDMSAVSAEWSKIHKLLTASTIAHATADVELSPQSH
eukprot:c1746_g1_i1.p1 GENE.c1746_g1_i1~~c1746_g1_i1.p1  ORF type:complete len:525 (-),score=122.97 c1746_g1_i1:34-1608(-)